MTAELSEKQIHEMLNKPPVWQQREFQRSLAIAVVSTAVFSTIVYLVLSNSEGWASFSEAFLSPEAFKASFPSILEAFTLNVKIFMIAQPIVLILGLIIAMVRGLREPVFFPLRVIAIAYTDLFRGAPPLLVILMLGLGMPALRISWLPTSPVFWGTVAIILGASAFKAELFRAGIESIHPSQRAAARSLGLSNTQAMRFVVLPQAVRVVIPPLISGFVGLMKESSLISVIGPLEAARMAQVYSDTTFNFTSYAAAALIFIALTIPLTRLTDFLLKRTERQRTGRGKV